MSTRTNSCTIAIVLLLLATLTTGCAAGKQAEAIFDPTPMPGVVRMGEPVEISLPETVGCIFGGSLKGSVLLGRGTLNGQAQSVIVNLATGKAYQLNDQAARSEAGTLQLRKGASALDPDVLTVYNVAEGKSLVVAEGKLSAPYISGDIAVWEETGIQERDIYGYNLPKGYRFTIAEGEGVRTAPQASGEWVIYVFEDARTQTTPALRAHHISKGDDFEIGLMPLLPGDQPSDRFKVSDGKVAWIGVNRGEVHVYDLEKRVDEIIFKDERPQVVVLGALDMKSDLIMWSGTSWGVVGYDMIHRQLFDIPDLPAEIRDQAVSSERFISESYVVWIVEEMDPLSSFMLTPPPPGESKPTPQPEVIAGAEQCRMRLFAAPLTRNAEAAPGTKLLPPVSPLKMP